MRILGLFVATLLLTACGGVECVNPASDAATTKADERLIGFWRIDLKASGAKDDSVRTDHLLFAIGRQPGQEGALALAVVGLEGGVLKMEQPPIRPTTIGSKAYVSVQAPPEGEGKEGRWTVVRYELPEQSTLHVLAMNEDEVAKDIRSGKVPGSVKNPEPGSVVNVTIATLSASVEALRAYLGTRGDGVFKADKPLVLKRLNLR